MKDWLRVKAFALWVEFGHKLFGFHHVGMYAPDDNIVAITLSQSEEYVDRVSEIKLEDEDDGT